MIRTVFFEEYPNLPQVPGVYQYYDALGQLLYVGKAKNLKKRIASYFQKNHPYPKTRILVQKIARITVTVTNSEHDAFLLENNLIKTHQPRYNINLKDDKSFPYLAIKKEPFPRVFFTRQKIQDGSEYLGPFTSIMSARLFLKYVRRNFTFRTCALHLSEKKIKAALYRPCLDYHIGRCKAPCSGRQSSEDYALQITEIRKLFKEGHLKKIIQQLTREMNTAAKKWDFESAEEKKRQIQLFDKLFFKTQIESLSNTDADTFAYEQQADVVQIHFLMIRNGKIVQVHHSVFSVLSDESKEEILASAVQQLRDKYGSEATEIIVPFAPAYRVGIQRVTIPVRGGKKKFLELAQQNIAYHKEAPKLSYESLWLQADQEQLLQQLQADLYLKMLPIHIECFDNSHFQGAYPVSAMVCFKYGLPSKKDYRVFKVKTVTGIDDFKTMYEAVWRRYRRLVQAEAPLPQLVIIDGGKGQLNAAVSALKDLNIWGQMTVIGLAKNQEEVFFYEDKSSKRLPYNAPSLRFIRQIRDETHRFVIRFHRQQRSKGTLRTELTKIKGIGKKLSEKLLLHFQSADRIKQTSLEDLMRVVGEHKAKMIKNYFI